MRPPSAPGASARGVTIVEVLAAGASLAVATALGAAGLNATEETGRELRCAFQQNAIFQGMTFWAMGAGGFYPIPSLIDAADQTELPPGGSFSKNRTGNICSILSYHGLVSLETWVCPGEPERAFPHDFDFGYARVRPITEDEFAFENPPGAVNPRKALWDPRFKGTPALTDGANSIPGQIIPPNVGNCSYAHLPLTGPWLPQWSIFYPASDIAVLGDRGPRYSTIAEPSDGIWKLSSDWQGVGSTSLYLHGTPGVRWRGNVTYNDGSIRFEPACNPVQLTVRYIADGTEHRDNLFIVEQIDFSQGPAEFRNAYLRQWRRGGLLRGNWGVFVNVQNSPATQYVWVDGMT